MENGVSGVNRQQKNYYKRAREIFFGMGPTDIVVIKDMADGLRVRNALVQVVRRNPTVPKVFKTKKKKDGLHIWRKI